MANSIYTAYIQHILCEQIIPQNSAKSHDPAAPFLGDILPESDILVHYTAQGNVLNMHH